MIDPRSVNALACGVSNRAVAIVAHPLAVMLLWLVSVATIIWSVAARTEMALTLALSIVALALSAAILLVQRRDKIIADERDRALHKKLDGIIGGTDADNALIGIEPS